MPFCGHKESSKSRCFTRWGTTYPSRKYPTDSVEGAFTTPSTLELTVLKCRIREGLAGPQEPALLTSGGRMPERSQHRVSGGLDGRSERPAMGSG